MTKQEIMARITQAEQQLNELKAELEKVEKEPTYEYVPEGQCYYYIRDLNGALFVETDADTRGDFDIAHHENNNYFHTRKRADEVLEKIRFLLKMERYHDIYCPDHKPDWSDNTCKYYVYYNNENGKYDFTYVQHFQEPMVTYFPDKKTAQAVCDRLNEELKQ